MSPSPLLLVSVDGFIDRVNYEFPLYVIVSGLITANRAWNLNRSRKGTKEARKKYYVGISWEKVVFSIR